MHNLLARASICQGDCVAEPPPDFDWVTVRHDCSLPVFFEALYLGAQRDTDIRNALGVHPDGGRFVCESHGVALFSVAREAVIGGLRAIRFTLRDDRIEVEGAGVADVRFFGTLTLNDRAECRLLVDGVELDRWQVLRRALEPLFFG